MAKNKNILDKIIEQTLKKPTVPGIPSVNNLSPTANFDAQYKLLQGKKYVPDPGLMKPEDVHNILTIASVVTLFIPLIGPAISAGISLNNAELYSKEGKPYEAGLEATFALIPGLGKLAKLTGVAQLGKQGMKTLAGKLIAIKAGKQVTLDATEKLALKSIAANKQLVETEVKRGLAARVAAGAGKVTARVSTDILATAAYDRLYVAAAGGITLNQWLENWWDEWSDSPITESMDIYKQIADQISLNEQMKTGVDWMDTALAGSDELDPMIQAVNDPTQLQPRVTGKDASGRTTTTNTPAADTKNSIEKWIDDNPVTTAAIGGSGLLLLILKFVGFKKTGKWLIGNLSKSKIKGSSTNSVTDITNISDLQLIADGLTQAGWKQISLELQKIRAQIFQRLKNGEITDIEAIQILNDAGYLPKKWNPIKRNKFIKKVKQYSKSTQSARTFAAKDAALKAAAEKKAASALKRQQKAALKKNPVNYTITPSK
jgi:hypothetical protein